MIFGVGIDIAKCARFEKWLKTPGMAERFFNPKEMAQSGADWNELTDAQKNTRLQHCAARFAAKEAFSKALGSGLVFELRDVFVTNAASGKPELCIEKSALKAFKDRCPDWQKAKIFVSLSHEKEYAVAQVIIEI